MRKQHRPFHGAAAVTVVALAGALATPSAQALDQKLYPGETCIKWTGNGVLRISNGSVGNSSATDILYVDCPAIRDGTSIESGYVWVTDRHSSGQDDNGGTNNPAENVICTLLSVGRKEQDSSAIAFASGKKYSYDNSNWVQRLEFGAAPAVVGGHYYYSCSIPARGWGESQIHTFSIREVE